MKKLIIIMLFMVAMFAVRAQTATIDFGTNTTQQTYSVSQTLTDTTGKWFQWNCSQAVPISLNYTVLLTKGTGSHTETTVQLYGKCFSGDAWVLIDTGLSGTITTTATVTIKVTTHLQYRYFKTLLTGTGTGTTKITKQEFKIWLQ
jgi:hypothetical protein